MNYHELKGFRTLYPKDLIKYKLIESILSKILQNYGYFPIEPPSLEYGDVLTAKGGLSPDQDKELFIFKDHGGRWIGLRFDLTTPIARIVANNQTIITKLPLRWYYFSKMWRYEQPQKGRYREFWQFGVELIGSDSAYADAEVLLISLKNIFSLGFDKNDFKIYVSHRDLLRGIFKHIGIEDEDKVTEIIRILDKKGKIDDENIIKLVGKIEQNQDLLKQITRILMLKPAEFDEIYKNYLFEIENYNDLTKNAVSRLKLIFNSLKENLTRDEYRCFNVDVCLARGFDYYTGMVFETFSMKNNHKQNGSLIGGGRYDNLISLFGNKKISAVGYAIGVDRVIETLEENKTKNIFNSLKYNADIHLIFDLNNNEHRKKAYLIKNKLIENNISVTSCLKTYTKFRKLLEKELKFADLNNIKYAIIIDDNTTLDNIIFKDLIKKEQKELTIKQIITQLKIDKK